MTAWVILGCLAAGTSTTADPWRMDNFEDIPTIGARPLRQSLEEKAAAISVITQEEIKRFGWRSLEEILSHVRGLIVHQDRTYESVGFRGISQLDDYNSRFLTLLNGHALNPLGMTGEVTAPVDVTLIERVEIFRGPGSALYGTHALLGMANIVLREAPDARQLSGAGVGGFIEGHSLLRHRAGVHLDRIVLGGRLLLATSIQKHRGTPYDLAELELDGPTRRESDALDDFIGTALFDHGNLSITSAWRIRQKRVPTASFASLPEEGERVRDRRGYVAVGWRSQPAPNHEITTKLAYDLSFYDGYYPYAPADGGVLRDEALVQWGTAELIYAARPTPGWYHAIGVNFQGTPKLSQNAYSADGSYAWSEGHEYIRGAVFGEAELALGDFRLSLGLRADAASHVTLTPSGHLGVSWSPSVSTTLKLFVGRGIRFPSEYEREYEDPYTNLANHTLDSELSNQIELILEQEFGPARLHLGAFALEIDRLIVFNPVEDGRLQAQNLGQRQAWGCDFELRGRWREFYGSAAYTLSVGSAVSTDPDASPFDLLNFRGTAPLPQAPRHLLQARLWGPLGLSTLYWAVAMRAFSSLAGPPERPSASGAVLLDATLTYDDFIPGADISLGATNLLNQKWAVPSSVDQTVLLIPQDKVAVWAKLSLSL